MIGVVLMLVAALCNASSSVLQRRATRDEPESRSFSLRMFLDLARRPVWFLGIATMITGFVLHGVSISLSRIAFVQPLLVVELPLTIVLASLVFKMRIGRRDRLSLAMQSVGLAAFVACLDPVGGNPNAVPWRTWLIGAAANVAAVVALVVLGYVGRHEHRAALLGIATGAAFGLNSSLIAGVGASVANGGNLFTTWQTYGVAVVGPSSFFLLQNALQAGNLVASQPGFTMTNPLVSVAWGIAAFHEQARTGPFLIGVIAGAALIGAGTIMLSRSPLLDPDASAARDQRTSGEGREGHPHPSSSP